MMKKENKKQKKQDKNPQERIANQVVKACFESGVAPILTSGSLLGAYRDGGMIKGDMDDIDFVLPQRICRLQLTQFVNAFLKRKFKIKLIRDTVVSFEKWGINVDFNFYRDYDHEYFCNIYYFKTRRFMMKTPKKFLQETGTINFLGQEFLCPKDIEGFLEWKYGDWRTPILRPNFTVLQCFNMPNLAEWIDHD